MVNVDYSRRIACFSHVLLHLLTIRAARLGEAVVADQNNAIFKWFDDCCTAFLQFGLEDESQQPPSELYL
jgi:hypothetical protein